MLSYETIFTLGLLSKKYTHSTIYAIYIPKLANQINWKFAELYNNQDPPRPNVSYSDGSIPNSGLM